MCSNTKPVTQQDSISLCNPPCDTIITTRWFFVLALPELPHQCVCASFQSNVHTCMLSGNQHKFKAPGSLGAKILFRHMTAWYRTKYASLPSIGRQVEDYHCNVAGSKVSQGWLGNHLCIWQCTSTDWFPALGTCATMTNPQTVKSIFHVVRRLSAVILSTTELSFVLASTVEHICGAVGVTQVWSMNLQNYF